MDFCRQCIKNLLQTAKLLIFWLISLGSLNGNELHLFWAKVLPILLLLIILSIFLHNSNRYLMFLMSLVLTRFSRDSNPLPTRHRPSGLHFTSHHCQYKYISFLINQITCMLFCYWFVTEYDMYTNQLTSDQHFSSTFTPLPKMCCQEYSYSSFFLCKKIFICKSFLHTFDI